MLECSALHPSLYLSAAIGNRLYVIGEGESVRSCEFFDSSSKRWTVLEDMEHKRNCPAACASSIVLFSQHISPGVIDDKLFLPGGFFLKTFAYRSGEALSVPDHKWTFMAHMKARRMDFAAGELLIDVLHYRMTVLCACSIVARAGVCGWWLRIARRLYGSSEQPGSL